MLSIIIPTYNEKQNIGILVDKLVRVLDVLLPNNYELIVVDDDSSDKTWEYARSLKTVCPHLYVYRRKKSRSLSTAVIRGWQKARGKILGVMDADLQHPPEAVREMLLAIQEEHVDLVVGTRYAENGRLSEWNFFRKIVSRFGSAVALMILPEVAGRVSDPLSGYFFVKRAAIAETPLNPLGYKILLEVLARGNIRSIAEVGINFQKRHTGTSKASWKIFLAYLIHLLRLRFSRKKINLHA